MIWFEILGHKWGEIRVSLNYTISEAKRETARISLLSESVDDLDHNLVILPESSLDLDKAKGETLMLLTGDFKEFFLFLSC